MTEKIQAVRGMNDILPQETKYWRYIEKELAQLAANYGYKEIRFPVLERTELFERSVGKVTDIVEKEMFTFVDRNNESLSLRPEGTASCVRAAIEHGMLYNQIQKLWYMGPLFRHERPQKGRYRQFHQFALEAFGVAQAEMDVEIILFCKRMWQQFKLTPYVKLEINTLGLPAERALYREQLVAYFNAHATELDEDSQRRLHTNPLRILDSKNPAMQNLIQQAPKLIDHLSEASRQHFNRVCELLTAAGLEYEINPRLVRGLDYYCHTVFEWTTTHLGAQATVCAGGRYDGLVEQLGGQATPAVGFAMGIERLLILLDTLQLQPEVSDAADIFILAVGEKAQTQGLLLAENLRHALTDKTIVFNCAGGSFKSQMKKADQSGACIALILGDDEVAQNKVSVKYMREDKPQELVDIAECVRMLEAKA